MPLWWARPCSAIPARAPAAPNLLPRAPSVTLGRVLLLTAAFPCCFLGIVSLDSQRSLTTSLTYKSIWTERRCRIHSLPKGSCYLPLDLLRRGPRLAHFHLLGYVRQAFS